MLAKKVAGALTATMSLVALAASASGETTPPAPAIAPDFQIVGNQSLRGLCAPSLVAPGMAAVLGAFNAGRAVAFAGASGAGIFGLFLRVRADGVAYEQGVKVIVSCSTGQIRKWRGPAWTPQH